MPPEIAGQILSKLDAMREEISSIKSVMATKDDLKNFATKEDIKNMATKDDLKNFATKEDVKNMATKDDLKNFATRDDLKKFATKDDLNQFATKDDLDSLRFELRDEIDSSEHRLLAFMQENFSTFATKEDQRALKQDLALTQVRLETVSTGLADLKAELGATEHRLVTFMRDNLATKEDLGAVRGELLVATDVLARRQDLQGQEIAAQRLRLDRIEEEWNV